MKTEYERFISKVEKTNSCWLWTGAKYRSGYGHFRRKIGNKWKMYKAHRYSYEYFKGSILEDYLVCHKCDTPNCVNPDHLFLGTHKDNMLDKELKGRHSYGRNKNHIWLSLDTAKEIREMYKTFPQLLYKELAKMFDTSTQQICRVVNNQIWKEN